MTSETPALKCELAAEVLRRYGTLRLQVNGWSMFPAVRPGDVLLINRASSSEGEQLPASSQGYMVSVRCTS